jgi:hypothetical protein
MKEIILPLNSGKIPELIRFIENDQSFRPEIYSQNLENVFI